MDTSRQAVLIYRKFLWEDGGESTLLTGYEDNVFEVFETTLYSKIIENIVNFFITMAHEDAAAGSSSRCHYLLVFITVIFFGFISKYYLQCVRNTFHLGVLLNTTHWCVRLIYNRQEFPFFWTLSYRFRLLVNQQTDSGAITTHWLTNKPVDVFSFWHVILDKYRSFL